MSPTELKIEALSDPSAVASLREEWDMLQRSLPHPLLFNSADWLLSWYHAFGHGGRSLRVLSFRREGKLIGVLPLMSMRAKYGFRLSVRHEVAPEDRQFLTYRRRLQWLPVRQLMGPAGMQSANNRASWAVEPKLEALVLEAAMRQLGRERDWQMLFFPALSAPQQASLRTAADKAGLRTRKVSTAITLYGLRPQPWQDYYQTRSRKFRKAFRAAERAFQRLPEPLIESITEPEPIPDLLQEMRALAQRSWKSAGRAGDAVQLPFTDAALEFLLDLAARRAPQGKLHIVTLRAGGELVGVKYNIVEAGVLFGLQTFYDRRISHASPGRLMLREIIDWSARHSIRRVDLNGHSPLLASFAESEEEHGALQVLGRGYYAGALATMAAASDRFAERSRASRDSETSPGTDT